MHRKSDKHWASSSHGPEDQVVSLSILHTGEHGEVVRLAGGHSVLSRMTALGFTPGADVTVIQNFGRGPLITMVRDARVALGRGEARRVYVRRRSL